MSTRRQSRAAQQWKKEKRSAVKDEGEKSTSDEEAGAEDPSEIQNPVLRLPQGPNSSYALSVMMHPNPIGDGFAMEARLEAAGPECIVPGQVTPVRILGLKLRLAMW